MYGENKNVIIKYGGRIYGKEISWAIDGKQVQRGMIECPVAKVCMGNKQSQSTEVVPTVKFMQTKLVS